MKKLKKYWNWKIINISNNYNIKILNSLKKIEILQVEDLFIG